MFLNSLITELIRKTLSFGDCHASLILAQSEHQLYGKTRLIFKLRRTMNRRIHRNDLLNPDHELGFESDNIIVKDCGARAIVVRLFPVTFVVYRILSSVPHVTIQEESYVRRKSWRIHRRCTETWHDNSQMTYAHQCPLDWSLMIQSESSVIYSWYKWSIISWGICYIRWGWQLYSYML